MMAALAAIGDAVEELAGGLGSDGAARARQVEARLGESRRVGSADDPVAFGGGSYWLDATSHDDGSYTLYSHAAHATSEVVLETRWERALHAIRDHAIFSGNLGHDPTHDLEFGGTGRSADVINGKVYADGSITVRGGARINADVTATEPSPKKIARHSTGSITSGSRIWNSHVPNTSVPTM